MKKRILSLALAIVMIVCLLPQSIFNVDAAITVFSQTDSRWGNHQYGYSNSAGTTRATISSGGCGILALVNAVYYMNGNFIDPITLADWSVNNGYRVNGVGTSHGLYPAFSKAHGSTYGFSCNSSTGTSSWNTLVSHLQNGGTAIVPVTTRATGNGHLLVIADYDSSNSTYLVLDSYASSNRGTSSGYAWMTKSQFQNRMSNSIFILINSNGSGSHTHSYSGSYYEAAHPHKEYQMCSCGATKYTGTTRNVSTCESCNPVNTTTKYNAVLSFNAYLKDTSKVYPYSTAHLSGSTSGEIWSTDECTITAVYSNGACKVSYPTGSGTKTAYTSLSNFVGNTSASLTKQTVNHQVTTYIRATTSSTIYGKIFAGDVIYKMGTSGSMTQVFYPTTSGYKLAWVVTSDLSEPTYDTRFNPYCPIKGYICATSTINAYSSDYNTDIGDIWTTDFCYINAVYADGWCNVTYPVGSGTKTGYAKLSDFVYNTNTTHVKYTANTQTTVYHTKDLVYIVSTDQPWYIDVGDVFYVISTYGSSSQVLYPIDAQYGGGYKIGWIATSALPKTTYTVSYNANGGSSAPASQTKTHGTALKLSTTVPTKTGYAFVGWATSSTATSAVYAPGASYTTDANLTLYAVWTLNKYEISYDANGGTNAPATQNKAHGTAITLSSSVPKKHFTVTFNANGGTIDVANRQVDCTFLGWSTSASATSASYQPGASFTTNANTTLYAVWKNNALAQYDFPLRDGYVFDGWYTAASGGTQVTSETVISKNMTVYAHWSLATYTVCYDANGGTGAPSEQTKTHGQSLTLSTAVPTRKNYTFLGWGTEENEATVQYQPGGTYTADSDIMLIAVWKFNLSPTISVGTVSAKAGDTITVPVSIADNPGISTFTLGFNYDTSRLKLKSVTANSALGGQFAYNTKAVWLGNGNTEYEGQILTLTFDVLTTATKGDAYVTVTYNTGDISNFNEENVDFAIVDGKVSIAQVHTHNYQSTVTAPTCTEAGSVIIACSDCGEVLYEEITSALGHSYSYTNNGETHVVSCANGCGYRAIENHSFVGGICICGAVEATEPTTDKNLTFGAQLYLESDLTMAFRVRSNRLAAYNASTAYLVVEREVYETGAKVPTVQTMIIREYTMDGDRLVFSYPGIAAAQMNDAIRATLHVKDATGKEYVSPVVNTSVATYLDGLLSNSTSDTKLMTLIMDMVNYGTAAQIFFDRHAEAPVNKAFESFKTYASYASADFTTALEDLSAKTPIEGAGGKLNLGLDLGTRIGIQYKVTLPDGIAAGDATLVITDAKGNILETLPVAGNTTDDRGRYIVNFYGNTSRDMRRTVYATAYANGEAITWTYAYSISTYAWGVQTNAAIQPQNLVNVTRAMMLYGDSAAAYFG